MKTAEGGGRSYALALEGEGEGEGGRRRRVSRRVLGPITAIAGLSYRDIFIYKVTRVAGNNWRLPGFEQALGYLNANRSRVGNEKYVRNVLLALI